MSKDIGGMEFKQIVDGAPDPIVISNEQGNILYVNNQAERYFGYTKDELINQPVEILVPDALRKKHVKLRETYMQHPVLRPMGTAVHLLARHKRGHDLPIDINLSPLETSSGETLITAIIRDVSDHRLLEENLHHMAEHDHLTGLINVATLTNKVNYAISVASRTRKLFAVVYIDVDNFKMINDTYGHATGDTFLKEFSNRLKNHLRHVDDISRIGGDEFVCLLAGMKESTDITPIIEKLQKTLSETYKIDGHLLYSSVSIGISFYPQDGQDVTTLLAKADAAMYRAKKSGKNQYIFCQGD